MNLYKVMKDQAKYTISTKSPTRGLGGDQVKIEGAKKNLEDSK